MLINHYTTNKKTGSIQTTLVHTHTLLIDKLFQILQDTDAAYITANSLRIVLQVQYAKVYKIMRTINAYDGARFAHERISFATFSKFLTMLFLKNPLAPSELSSVCET